MAASNKLDRAKKRAGLIQDYKRTFETPVGKNVLMDLMRTHHMMGPVMDANPIDMAFKEGERNVVLRILRALNTNAEELYKRLKEQEEQE